MKPSPEKTNTFLISAGATFASLIIAFGAVAEKGWNQTVNPEPLSQQRTIGGIVAVGYLIHLDEPEPIKFPYAVFKDHGHKGGFFVRVWDWATPGRPTPFEAYKRTGATGHLVIGVDDVIEDSKGEKWMQMSYVNRETRGYVAGLIPSQMLARGRELPRFWSDRTAGQFDLRLKTMSIPAKIGGIPFVNSSVQGFRRTTDRSVSGTWEKDVRKYRPIRFVPTRITSVKDDVEAILIHLRKEFENWPGFTPSGHPRRPHDHDEPRTERDWREGEPPRRDTDDVSFPHFTEEDDERPDPAPGTLGSKSSAPTPSSGKWESEYAFDWAEGVKMKPRRGNADLTLSVDSKGEVRGGIRWWKGSPSLSSVRRFTDVKLNGNLETGGTLDFTVTFPGGAIRTGTIRFSGETFTGTYKEIWRGGRYKGSGRFSG